MRGSISALLCIVSLALATSSIEAQTPEAEAARHFEAGSAAYKQGEFRAAAERFEAAHRLAPRAATAYSAALAWEAAAERPRAADALETALALPGLSATEVEDAQSRLVAHHRSIGIVTVTGPIGATASALHVSSAAVPARFHANPGPVDVTIVRRDGSRVLLRAEVTAGETVRVAAEDAPAPSIARPAPSTRAVAPRPSPSPASNRSSAQVTLGVISLGVSAGAVAAAAFLGAETLSTRDEFEATGYRSQALHDDTIALRAWTNVAWGAAATFAITGVVLLVTSGRSTKPQERARPSK